MKLAGSHWMQRLDEAFDKTGLERLIRYCARPPFKSENIRLNGTWVHYRLPKQCHTGKTFIQLEPLDFIERISHFISFHTHTGLRRHYYGIFALNSPLRKQLVANAQKQQILIMLHRKSADKNCTKSSLTHTHFCASDRNEQQ